MNIKKNQNVRIWPSIKKDKIHPKDYLTYDFRISCEDCSHFNLENSSCTLGYKTDPHRKKEQIKSYILSGNVALCRFHEID